MKNLGYLQCQKGGYHSGEFLNIICLDAACRNNVLCCCACVQEFHSSHKTKTLKKLLLDAETLAKNHKEQSKPTQKTSKSLNTDIMANMVENEQKNIINKLHELKQNFVKEIDDLENCIHTYFKSLYQELSKTSEASGKDPKLQVLEAIEIIQGAGTIQSLKNNIIRLLKGVNVLEKTGDSVSLNYQPDEQQYLNFLKNSNTDIQNIVEVRIKGLQSMLAKQVSKMKDINNKISSFWSNKLYKFDPIMIHNNVQIVNPFTVKATIDSVYQMALMSPPLSFENQVETFTFRINANDLEWVGVGVAYKKIANKLDYEFNFHQSGHGCYMISGNAGTWSHSDSEFNNVVKGFAFKQGDSITCTVSKNKICFFKNVPPELEQSFEYSQKQYYELEIKNEPNDILHPCVVSFYENTIVEYLPSFKNIQLNLPNYTFKFNSKTKHPNLFIYNDNHLVGCEPTAYKCCILDKPIEGEEVPKDKKSVSFRVVKSSGWIGLGVCHKNIVVTEKFDFSFENVGHGCYMISSNGGSWSNINANENNIVKTFKFQDGDLVTVSLDEKERKVRFRRGIDSYELKYTPFQGDPLYPVAILYYPNDEVDVLPDF